MFFHHAYITKSELGKEKEILSLLFPDLLLQGNSNISFFNEQVLGIDAARYIKEQSLTKSFNTTQRRFFVISFESATKEAQNSLLKLLEDPQDDLVLVIITPYPDDLLATLMSRLNYVTVVPEKKETDDFLQLALHFADSSLAERLEIIKKMKEDEEDQEKKGIRRFLDSLELVLGRKIKSNHALALPLQKLYNAKEMSRLKGIPSKMLLEYLACVIPQT